MIRAYLNQSVTWKHVASLNTYNEPTYSSTTIKARKEGVNKLINNQTGQVAVSSTRIFTESAISVNDLIDDRQVLRVDAVVGVNGAISHYEVYLQ
jgi:hypothetical protein